jgi:hypothetical protein
MGGRGSISGRGRDFSVLYNVHTGSGAQPMFIQWVHGDYSLGGKWQGHEAFHSHLSSAEVKNA